MEITKSQKRLLILLGIVLIYAAYDFISNKDTYMGFYGKSKKTVVAKKKNAQKAVKKENTALAGTSYLEHWSHDPFYKKIKSQKKSVAKKLRKINFHLFAVSIKANESVALINDKMVKEGDMISGYTVTNIGKKKVTLTKGKKTVVLNLVTY